MVAWDVFNGDNKWMDTVFYSKNCDEDYVKRGLIDHDDFPFDIIIKENTDK